MFRKRWLTTPVIAKIFIVMREQLCDGDNPHGMRNAITVEQAEKYTEYIDAMYKKGEK